MEELLKQLNVELSDKEKMISIEVSDLKDSVDSLSWGRQY